MPHLSTHANLPSPTPLLGWTDEVCKVGGAPMIFFTPAGPRALPPPTPKMPFDGQSVTSAVSRHLSIRPPPAEGCSVTSVLVAL